MIRIENLKKQFGDLQVLKGVSLEVERGEVISIVGIVHTCEIVA